MHSQQMFNECTGPYATSSVRKGVLSQLKQDLAVHSMERLAVGFIVPPSIERGAESGGYPTASSWKAPPRLNYFMLASMLFRSLTRCTQHRNAYDEDVWSIETGPMWEGRGCGKCRRRTLESTHLRSCQ